MSDDTSNDTPTLETEEKPSKQQLLDEANAILAEPGGTAIVEQALAKMLQHRMTAQGEEDGPLVWTVLPAIDRDRWGDPRYEAARKSGNKYLADFDKADRLMTDAYDMARVLHGYLLCDNVEPEAIHAESVVQRIYKLLSKASARIDRAHTDAMNLFLAYQDMATRYVQAYPEDDTDA